MYILKYGLCCLHFDPSSVRNPSWVCSLVQAPADRGDNIYNINTKKDGTVVRGRGGMGRRGNEDFIDQGAKGTDEERKSGKRRLFSSVLDRFDKDKGDKDGGRIDAGSMEQSSLPRDGSSVPEGRKWLTPGSVTRPDGSVRDPNLPVSHITDGLGPPAAAGSGEGASEVRRGNGTWGKAAKSNNPERFARFLGKVLGVRDDALPDDVDTGSRDRMAGDSLDEPGQRRRSKTDVVRDGVSADGGVGVDDEIVSATSADKTGAAATAAAELPPVTATAVYTSSAVRLVTTDAMPVAVAVAVPVTADAVPVVRPNSENDRPLARSVRPQRPGTVPGVGARRGAAATAAASAEAAPEIREKSETPGVASSSVPVSISDWVVKEQRESGGLVRVFAAQRVVEGKVQKRCRLAVSPKHMTQVSISTCKHDVRCAVNIVCICEGSLQRAVRFCGLCRVCHCVGDDMYVRQKFMMTTSQAMEIMRGARLLLRIIFFAHSKFAEIFV